jgi:taurine transport system permease protein
MRQRTANIESRILGLAGVFSFVVLWFVATPSFVPELLFPSPRSVWQVVTTLRFELLIAAWYTLLRVVSGWAIGSIVGVGFGLGMASSRRFAAVANPIIEAVRPLPPVALIPFFILWFGIGASGQILLISLGCFMVMTVTTFVTVGTLSPGYLRVAASLGATKRSIYRRIILPAIMPALLAGVRVSAALAFGLGVAAEFMGAQSGIGFMMMVARRTLNTNTILVGLLVIGLESYAIDWFIRWRFRRMCGWLEKPEQALDQLGTTGRLTAQVMGQTP